MQRSQERKLGARGDQTSTMSEHIGNTARLSLKRDEDAHGQKTSPPHAPPCRRHTASIAPPNPLEYNAATRHKILPCSVKFEYPEARPIP
jgi:hypothetical protein